MYSQISEAVSLTNQLCHHNVDGEWLTASVLWWKSQVPIAQAQYYVCDGVVMWPQAHTCLHERM